MALVVLHCYKKEKRLSCHKLQQFCVASFALWVVQFSPPVVEEVTEEMVDAYFRPFEDPARELKLAVRERRFALSHL